jgi:toxin ParE1/3/4
MSRFSFHRLARRELDEAAQYYEAESPGLGSRYLDAVESCVRGVVELPATGAVILDHVRRKLVHGFPYAVLYREVSGRVRILAIMNLKRRPMYWAGRE